MNYMKRKNEFSGAYPLENRQVYVSPEVEIVDIQVQDLIAVSADYVNVVDPWGDNTETEW